MKINSLAFLLRTVVVNGAKNCRKITMFWSSAIGNSKESVIAGIPNGNFPGNLKVSQFSFWQMEVSGVKY